MQVHSTPTAADAWADRKNILDGNALLKQQRDTLLREVAQWQPVLHAIKAEVAAHLNVAEVAPDLNALLSTKLMEQRDELQGQIDAKTSRIEDLKVQETVKEKDMAAKDAQVGAKTAHLATLQADIDQYAKSAVVVRTAHEQAVLAAQTEIPKVQEE